MCARNCLPRFASSIVCLFVSQASYGCKKMVIIYGRYLPVLVVLLGISQAFTRGNRNRCRIPVGPVSERSIYKTRDLSKLSAGSFVPSRQSIIITCKADIYGDIIAKQHYSYCRNGRWLRRLPRCIEYKRCAAPEVIPGTTVSEPMSEAISFPHEYVIYYTCTGDAQLIGHDETVCENGRWSEPEFDCRESIEIVCQPPQHEGLVYEPKLEGYAENQTVTLTGCEGTRMIFEGSAQLTCLPDGSWSGNAVCRLSTQRGNNWFVGFARTEQCADPEVLSEDGYDYMVVVPGKRCKPTAIRHGAVFDRAVGVSVKCRSRFTYDKTTPITLDCIDGQWVGPRPTCRPASCTLPAPKMDSSIFVDRKTNLIVTDAPVSHGDKIRQYCRGGSGLQLVDNKCFLGRWEKRFRNCAATGINSRLSRYRSSSAAPCQLPHSVFAFHNVDNETVEVTGVVASGNSVQAACREDSIDASTVEDNLLEVYCLEGAWVPELPECSHVPEPDTNTGEVSTGSTDNADVTTDGATEPETDEDSSSTNELNCIVMTNNFVQHGSPGHIRRRMATRTQFVYGVRTVNDCQIHCLEWTEFFCTDIEVRSVKNRAGFINCNFFYVDPKRRQSAVAEDPDSINVVYQRTCDSSSM